MKLDPRSPPYAGQSFSQLVLYEWVDGAKNSRDEVIQESFDYKPTPLVARLQLQGDDRGRWG